MRRPDGPGGEPNAQTRTPAKRFGSERRRLRCSSHNILPTTTLTCDNGATVVVNPGTTNQSHMGFVVGSTSILVVNYVAFTDATGTFVLVDSAPALSGRKLVTCTGDAGFGGLTVTVRGFFTPPT